METGESLIQKVIAVAQNSMLALGWKLVRLDEDGRGSAVFQDTSDAYLIFEIGIWYPEIAHHLDDEPSLILFYKDKEKDSLKVQIPYVNVHSRVNLYWKSSQDEIKQHVEQVLANFKENFLNKCPDRGLLFNFALDSYIQVIGILDLEIFRAIKAAIALDQVTPVTWAEKKLSLFRRHIEVGESIFVFDPVLNRLRPVATLSDFDGYVESCFR